MDRLDEELKKALHFFAKCTSKRVHRMATEEPTKYRTIVPIHIENYLVKGKYVIADDFSKNPRETFPITPEGLKLLINLEQAEIDKKSFWISILALGVSGLTFLLYIIEVTRGTN
jgi:hypothetical protein